MESVTSGAPQKSVLEPVLESVVFDIFINDWGYGAEYPSSQPVGYTTVGGLLDGLHGCSGAHQGPDRLQKCGNGNLTKFNTGKSQVLHLGSHSLHPMLGALWLEAALQKGPLGSRVCIWQRKPTAT